MQLCVGKLGGAVDGDEEIELALGGLHLGDVDVEVADRIGLELLANQLVAFDLRQTADPMALQAAIQRGPRQVRNGRLQRVEAVIQRQQRVLAEGDDDRLLFQRQQRRAGLLRPGRPLRCASSTSQPSSG